MKLKILGNVKHNGTPLSRGDVVEMDKSFADVLIECGKAEVSKSKVTKKLSAPESGKGFQVHLKTKETVKKASKKGNE